MSYIDFDSGQFLTTLILLFFDFWPPNIPSSIIPLSSATFTNISKFSDKLITIFSIKISGLAILLKPLDKILIKVDKKSLGTFVYFILL